MRTGAVVVSQFVRPRQDKARGHCGMAYLPLCAYPAVFLRAEHCACPPRRQLDPVAHGAVDAESGRLALATLAYRRHARSHRCGASWRRHFRYRASGSRSVLVSRGHGPGSRAAGRAGADPAKVARSEEHTSELQSLMRISYAVFCLKKKKKTNTI